MDEQRVREILESMELIQVHYRGIPVYIDELNNNQTATVFPLDEINNLQQVDLDGLEEVNLMDGNETNQ